jgi:hypothetical protein
VEPTVATRLHDLVTTTLRDLGKPNYTELATDTQDHVAWNELLQTNRVEMQSGTGVQWDVMVNHSQSARNQGLGGRDEIDIVDTMTSAQADWRGTTVNWAFLGPEIDMNAEPARIVDLVKQREAAAMIALAEKMESNFWGPPVASDDEVTPWGIKTWLVKNATTGFTGGAPSGYSTIGLNPTTFSRWKNFAGLYGDITPDDLFALWSKAATLTKFKAPVKTPTFDTGYKMAFYTNYAALAPMEQQLRVQNSDLGNDLAKYDGEVMFRRIPVRWVPRLDADTTNPVYGINWGSFKTIYLKNWWLRRTRVPIYPGQHTMNATFLDCIYQWVMKNRRCHFVLATGTSEPS